MKTEIVRSLTDQFEARAQKADSGVEFWLARDIPHLLGYTKWDNFFNVVSKAKTACEVSGHAIEFDFHEVRFIVGNAGSMPATKIRFQVTDNVPWQKMEKFESGFQSVSAIRNGISYLAPGRILKYNAGFVDRDPAFFSDTSSIEIQLTFETDSGMAVKREFVIELRAYSGVLLESFTHPEREVARAIRDAESRRDSKDTFKTLFKGSRNAAQSAVNQSPRLPRNVRSILNFCRSSKQALRRSHERQFISGKVGTGETAVD